MYLSWSHNIWGNVFGYLTFRNNNVKGSYHVLSTFCESFYSNLPSFSHFIIMINISDLHDLSYYLKNFKKLKPNRKKIKNRKQQNRTFLTVQWLRLHTPVQEAGVQSLIREDAAWWTQMKRKQ